VRKAKAHLLPALLGPALRSPALRLGTSPDPSGRLGLGDFKASSGTRWVGGRMKTGFAPHAKKALTQNN